MGRAHGKVLFLAMVLTVCACSRDEDTTGETTIRLDGGPGKSLTVLGSTDGVSPDQGAIGGTNPDDEKINADEL